MDNRFFTEPIRNSPYEYPREHWELDAHGKPTQRIVEGRRRAEFITPIPKPKKRKTTAAQQAMVFDEGKGISTEKQQYDPTSIINELRYQVDQWRSLPNPNDWQVTPETTRLLQHWRHHKFSGVRPFFCQIEAVEAAIWLTEVAPHAGSRVTEKQTIVFRAEFFNLFNHPQFNDPNQAFNLPVTPALPDVNAGPGVFGAITSTSVNPRVIQLGLKYIF